MPLETLHDHSDSAWALWKIEEEEKTLAAKIHPFEPVPAAVTNPAKRLEFLAGRVLIQALLEKWSLTFEGLRKDQHGKPFFIGHDINLSVSHSFPYVAAIIHKHKSVGIDLEQPKEKLLRIAARVLNSSELQDAGEDVVKHCVYWCAKETLIKIYGKRHLILASELAIEPFALQKQGNLLGSIIADNTLISIPLVYRVYDNFVVVLNT
jgi:4'-phosphopantetheinyl transferase